MNIGSMLLRRMIWICFFFLWIFVWNSLVLWWWTNLEFYGNDGTILTDKQDDVINKEVAWWEWFSDGIDLVVWEGKIEWIYDGEIETTEDAWQLATDLMKWTVNYALWLIWLIALIYLMYHWFLTLTAWSNDEQASKWRKWIRYAFIAIAWIWLAWFFLSLIFRLIFTVTWATGTGW